MSPSSDAYEVLGVASTATEDELRRAYRRALRRTHPDTGGEAVEFHAVQAAWEVLGTPEDRARYDSVGNVVVAHLGPCLERSKRTRSLPWFGIGGSDVRSRWALVA
jgi:curved DNA-binding protein CbpA